MKLFFISAFLLSVGIGSAAFADECPNLSHQTKLGDADVVFTQNGCESWTSQSYFKGKPVGKAVTTKFSRNWEIQNIDDEYEKGVLKHRWFWTRDKTKIVHDFEHEVFDKTSKLDTFGSMSTSYSDDREAILNKGYSSNRKENEDGSVEIKSTLIEDRLKK